MSDDLNLSGKKRIKWAGGQWLDINVVNGNVNKEGANGREVQLYKGGGDEADWIIDYIGGQYYYTIKSLLKSNNGKVFFLNADTTPEGATGKVHLWEDSAKPENWWRIAPHPEVSAEMGKHIVCIYNVRHGWGLTVNGNPDVQNTRLMIDRVGDKRNQWCIIPR